MATGTFTVYSPAVLAIAQGSIDLGVYPLVMALLNASYTPADTHATWADVSAAQVASSGGYAGPVAVTNQSCTLSGNTVTYNCDPVVWSNAIFQAKYAVLVYRAGASIAAGDKLIGYVDLNVGGQPVQGQGGQLSVAASVNGWFTMNHVP